VNRLLARIVRHFHVIENGERERRLKEIEEIRAREDEVRRRAVQIQQRLITRQPPPGGAWTPPRR
jgi:hypothetical protein